MTLQQLKIRQQTLLNLIANVGGKNNIRKWVDELMVVEARIEELEAATPAVQVVYDDSNFNYTSPWVVLVGGKEVQRFGTAARCDRFILWNKLSA
jgi:hypothetical protein